MLVGDSLVVLSLVECYRALHLQKTYIVWEDVDGEVEVVGYRVGAIEVLLDADDSVVILQLRTLTPRYCLLAMLQCLLDISCGNEMSDV